MCGKLLYVDPSAAQCLGGKKRLILPFMSGNQQDDFKTIHFITKFKIVYLCFFFFLSYSVALQECLTWPTQQSNTRLQLGFSKHCSLIKHNAVWCCLVFIVCFVFKYLQNPDKYKSLPKSTESPINIVSAETAIGLTFIYVQYLCMYLCICHYPVEYLCLTKPLQAKGALLKCIVVLCVCLLSALSPNHQFRGSLAKAICHADLKTCRMSNAKLTDKHKTHRRRQHVVWSCCGDLQGNRAFVCVASL